VIIRALAESSNSTKRLRVKKIRTRLFRSWSFFIKKSQPLSMNCARF